jgi:hypothetical protein
MPITKASGNSVTAAAKGDLVVGNATNDSGVLSVGANDTVLTADSSTATGLKWAAPSSGGMTLLSTTTLSGTSVTVSSISADYTDLYIFFAGLNMSGQTKIQAYFNNNSAIIDSTGTNGVSTSNYLNGPQNSFIQFNYGDFQGTDGNNAFSIRVNNYANTSYYKTFQSTFGGVEYSNNNARSQFGGVIKTNSAISTFNLINSDARTFTGNLKIYGVK